jgi:SAM-dependent methyltransferase
MKGRKRSLSQTGGKCRLSGDPSAAGMLAVCLKIDRAEKPAFTHGFHPYPARMHPQTARKAVEQFPAKRILDPFVGSGTVALEAVRSGAEFVGRDLSPVALEIAWCRTRNWHPDRCREFERRALAVPERAYGLAERAEFELPPWAEAEKDWYDPHTLKEVAALWDLVREETEKDKDFGRMMMGVLSSIVVRMSRQISDSDVKRDRYHLPRPRHAAFRAFKERVPELTSSLLQLSSHLYKRKVDVKEPRFETGDARELKMTGFADLILSSPPYAGVYDYARHQDRRYPLYGFECREADVKEIGSRSSRGEGYREDLRKVLKAMREALSPKGKILLLIGDGMAGPADRLLAELTPEAGLRVVAGAAQKRRDFAGALQKEEHLVLLQPLNP